MAVDKYGLESKIEKSSKLQEEKSRIDALKRTMTLEDAKEIYEETMRRRLFTQKNMDEANAAYAILTDAGYFDRKGPSQYKKIRQMMAKALGIKRI